MLNFLRNRTFRHLFADQLIALIGTGLVKAGLGLLAWRLAGDDARLVLGTALAIKMIADVSLAPSSAKQYGQRPSPPLPDRRSATPLADGRLTQ